MTEIVRVREFSMESLRMAIVMTLFRRKMRQQDLAEKVGCSVGHLSKVLTGETYPSILLMTKIFDVLDVKISLYDEGEEDDKVLSREP